MLVIDNYDSFTYNLVQYLGELGETVEVYRNDEITLDEMPRRRPAQVVISPGPCTPNEAGISVPLIERLSPEKFPCLAYASGTRASARRSRAHRPCRATDARQDLRDPP